MQRGVKLKIVWIFIFLGVGIWGTFPTYGQESPAIVQGSVDLSQWKFAQAGNVHLDGEWEFYWKQLLEPKDFQNSNRLPKSSFLKVPGSWNDNPLSQEKFSEKGYGTLRLQINLKPNQQYALKVNPMSTAYHLWLNDKKVASNGIVGKNASSTTPQYLPQLVTFDGQQPTLQILLQISNYHHQLGGPLGNIEFGLVENVRKSQHFDLALDLLLIGSSLIMALFHFSLYVLRRKDIYLLYFGGLCLLTMLQILVGGSMFLGTLMPQIPWAFHLKIDYLSFFLLVPLFMMFIEQLYPRAFHKTALHISQGIGGFFGLFVVFTQPSLFTQTLWIYQIITICSGLYLFYVLFIAISKRREAARQSLVILIALSLLALNDLFNDYGLLSTGYFLRCSLFLFLLALSFILSRRFSSAFLQMERISAELETMTQNLGNQVMERTEELEKSHVAVQEKNEIFHALLKTAITMHQTNELDNLLEQALSELKELFPSWDFGLILEGERPENIKNAVFMGISREKQDQLLRDNRYLQGKDKEKYLYGEDQIPDSNDKTAERWKIMTILGHEQKILGKLIMHSSEFEEFPLEVISIFLEQVGAFVENIFLTDELKKQANTDGLTGAYNRAYFDRLSHEFIERAKRFADVNFSILMMDINGLKRVNDLFGHEKGDEMIIKATQMITKASRSSDIPVRLGGDELLLLCPATNYEQGLALRGRIRAEEKNWFVACRHSNGDPEDVPIHVSIGVASSDTTDPDDVQRISDERMYADKEEYYRTREKYR